MGSTTRSLIKHESLFIVLPVGFTGGTQIQFPDDQYIRNKKLMALEVVPDIAETSVGGSPMLYTDGKIIASRTILKDCYLTLESYSGTQFLRKKPVLSLSNFMGVSSLTANSGFGVATPPNFVGQKVNWPKSYIEFPVIPAIGTELYVLFDVFFTELNKKTLQTQLGVGFQQKS